VAPDEHPPPTHDLTPIPPRRELKDPVSAQPVRSVHGTDQMGSWGQSDGFMGIVGTAHPAPAFRVRLHHGPPLFVPALRGDVDTMDRFHRLIITSTALAHRHDIQASSAQPYWGAEVVGAIVAAGGGTAGGGDEGGVTSGGAPSGVVGATGDATGAHGTGAGGPAG